MQIINQKTTHEKTMCEAFHLYLKNNRIEQDVRPFDFENFGDKDGGADYNNPKESFLIELKRFKPDNIHKIENKSAEYEFQKTLVSDIEKLFGNDCCGYLIMLSFNWKKNITKSKKLRKDFLKKISIVSDVIRNSKKKIPEVSESNPRIPLFKSDVLCVLFRIYKKKEYSPLEIEVECILDDQDEISKETLQSYIHKVENHLNSFSTTDTGYLVLEHNCPQTIDHSLKNLCALLDSIVIPDNIKIHVTFNEPTLTPYFFYSLKHPFNVDDFWRSYNFYYSGHKIVDI
jgi:hypothetical protein